MKIFNYELWFVTGSQSLYGEETLKQVAEDSRTIAAALDNNHLMPARIVFKPVLTTSDAITKLCLEANSDQLCAGIITWMHTFSPAKMWIAGLSRLHKPMLHFHTQFNRDIPWKEIDMNFMNLNQSAHGDREFGYICSRLRLNRKVVTGHWQDNSVIGEIAAWVRSAVAFTEAGSLKVARFGDNMRDVAVTEGNKVSAQLELGYEVHGFGVGDLVSEVNAVSATAVKSLVEQYGDEYMVQPEVLNSPPVREAARIELGMRNFLEKGSFKAFTTTFEDLHGLAQLPGLAVQRLMAAGYGFGAEGDWKTAALVRCMKVMAAGLEGGTSFMEDYTYHLDPGNPAVLGAHMLEVCPSLADGKPSLQVHPLGIGGKNDPARLVFKTRTGEALNASLIDLGDRFRLVVNPVEVIDCPDMPKLPVASVLWKPRPNLKTAATAWIYAGGAHHTGFSQALNTGHLVNFAEIAGIECIVIDDKCRVDEFKKELRWNDLFYHI
ncbi:MAG TPA: L-arabinose isomerase [Bacteroidales bacterium]|nr:L-arabinose isomerase [Bacteroidales bacterium]HNR40980.1 L-arabinose isomerase [Bacteroidales bacterium]HPM18153.1 L-arabinose isomerase [Bacteroidales bacterium]